MAIVKMKRFRLIALEQDRAALFAKLQRLGCVEISEAEEKLHTPEWAELLRRETSSIGDVKAQISQVQHGLDALKKYAPVKGGLFIQRPFMPESAFLSDETHTASLHIASDIGECLSDITRCNTREHRLQATKASLLPWVSLDYPLSHLSTEHVKIRMGVCPAVVSVDQFAQALNDAAPLSALTPLSQDRDQHYLLLLLHEAEAEAADEVLKSFSFSYTQFKEMDGTPQEEIRTIEAELLAVATQRTQAEERIASYGQHRSALRHCMDRLTQDFAREAAREHLLTDGTIVFLEGWAAATGLDRLEHLLADFSCAYSLEDPTKEDTPPTLLKNPKWMSCINMVTEMYSLPAYHGGIDPNPLIFGFFILYFGFMFADIAYGIILTVICSIIVKKYRPKNTMGYMFHLGIYLGISTIAFGFVTGSFFGDAITVFAQNFLNQEIVLPYLINPLSDPMNVLVVAIGLGIFQLICGQIIHMYMCFRDGAPLDAILDVIPWWIFFGGIVLMVLQGNAIGLIAGVVILVLTQGRHKKGIFGKLFGGIASLYDVTSWLSDVLSYCRLMALMLATSVIASVMNILGALPGNMIAFFVIFVIGHVFNIGVNIIGTYVHAARLQYLEFFGKFYLEGGIPFRPLAYQTKYVDILSSDAEKEAD